MLELFNFRMKLRMIGDLEAEPYFRPFVGPHYRTPIKFPKRLLVVGESHYLKPQDNRSDFVQDLITKVLKDRLMRGWSSRYYSNLFYLLTGKHGRDVEQSEWESVWHSLAFYNFVQTSRLDRPLMRPTREEWEKSIAPFKTVLNDLEPELIVLTGRHLSAYAARGGIETEGTVGAWLPTKLQAYAFTRCVNHPSSRQSKELRQRQRELVKEMFERDWPVPITT